MADVVLLLAVLAISAFFSAVESALFAISGLRLTILASGKDRRGQAIAATMTAPNGALITLLVGNNFANLGGTAFATAVALGIWGEDGLAVAVPLMTVLILVVTEVLPKTVANNQPEPTARALIRPFQIAQFLAWPFRIVLGRLTQLVIDVVGRRLGRGGGDESDEDRTTGLLKAAVQLGHDEGILAPFEKELFDNLSEVHDLEVREVMTPRTEIIALPATSSVGEARRSLQEKWLTRVPIYESRFENLVGLLHATDLLQAEDSSPIRPLLRPLFYVPESKPVVDLLGEFRRRGVHFAVAVEESGGIAGIATLEDVLEEIVGEIRDERDVLKQHFVRRSENSIIVSARMELYAFNEVFGQSLEAAGVETVGGYILTRAGRIPKAGDILFLDDLLFVIRKSEPNRIVEVEVTRFPALEARAR